MVPVEEFFDGNDDLGSIGCNLVEHPGIDVFRDTLIGIARRADVVVVYAAIAEVDPGEGSWPFADTIFVVGTIPRGELAEILAVAARRNRYGGRLRRPRGADPDARCAGSGRMVGLRAVDPPLGRLRVPACR